MYEFHAENYFTNIACRYCGDKLTIVVISLKEIVFLVTKIAGIVIVKLAITVTKT